MNFVILIYKKFMYLNNCFEGIVGISSFYVYVLLNVILYDYYYLLPFYGAMTL